MATSPRPSRVRKILLFLVNLGISSLCAVGIGLAGIYIYLDPQIPKAETFRNVELQTPLRIYASGGELIGEFGERRLIPISIKDVPPQFINAILDTEDKRFYDHNGIDYISLTNDIFQLIGSMVAPTGGKAGGASTITMQLARNVSFTLERKFLRKFKEMLLALKIEQELSKDEILELYINIVPFGKRAYGAEAAALTYYGKSLKDLKLEQLAMLAGIPQRPEAGNPINGPTWALRRRNQVLGRMLSQNSITRAEYDQAVKTPLSAQVYARTLDLPSPYAAEWARQQVQGQFADLYTGGYEIYTTLDANMQAAGVAAMRKGLEKYDRGHGYRGPEAVASADIISLINAQFSTKEDETLAQELEANPNGFQRELVQPINEEILAPLQNIKIFTDMVPAIVTQVGEQEAIAYTLDGQAHSITRLNSLWARAYVDVDRRGPPLTSIGHVVAVGDIIRLQKRFSDKTKQASWQLAQLPEIQGALVSLDPESGDVKAMVGGYDFYRNQYNYALQSTRQPGSGFKPFLYSTAIANGVTPADIFLDAPLVFDDKNLESQYRPDNDNNRYNGPTRLREALYRSINLVSMRVLLRVGAGKVLNHVKRFGFDTSSFPRNTQLAIGGGTMTVAPLDMAKAYAVLANGGYLVEPQIIDRIVNQNGQVVFANKSPKVCRNCPAEEEPAANTAASRRQSLAADPTDWLMDNNSLEDLVESIGQTATQAKYAPRVLDERNAFIMQSMLRDVVKRGTGRRALVLKRNDLAGKTGTTNDAADTWFNGFNSSLVASVWVGFSGQDPLGSNAYGSNIPLPIWIDFMKVALVDVPEILPSQPAGVVTIKVDPKTGEAVSPSNPNGISEIFLTENAPNAAQSTNQGGGEVETIRAVDLF
ncbi:MAG: PBP1A family penicillin-binding protein [Gammaproteobacteria bacterium]|jgi:penicillin-binding protein 1A|nr:PBP1A family penicillin-binding protein [Gammaproteobacteria bacterium]MBT5680793.1 PBP1A family penicillin-binding protein [Gammaproteobacteria bacterium]